MQFRGKFHPHLDSYPRHHINQNQRLAKKRHLLVAFMTQGAWELLFKEELGDRDTLVFRAKETRESTYDHATIIQDLMMAQLQIAQKDPTQAYKAATAMKALS